MGAALDPHGRPRLDLEELLLLVDYLAVVLLGAVELGFFPLGVMALLAVRYAPVLLEGPLLLLLLLLSDLLHLGDLAAEELVLVPELGERTPDRGYQRVFHRLGVGSVLTLPILGVGTGYRLAVGSAPRLLRRITLGGPCCVGLRIFLDEAACPLWSFFGFAFEDLLREIVGVALLHLAS